jgi:FkbM family methyltransferase
MLNTLRRRMGTAAGLWKQGRIGRYTIAKLLAASGLSRRFTIRIDDYALRFHPAALAVTLWTDPTDRADDRAQIRGFLRPGDTVIDVGANIGDLAICAARSVGPSGLVYAIEPHPRVFEFLRDNIALNGLTRHIVPWHLALGAAEGTATLSDRSSDDQNSLMRDGSAPGAITVPVRRLDQLELRGGPIRLLKIDVEGFEKFVLEGATALLPRVDIIYFESWESRLASQGCSTPDVLALLTQQDFAVYRFSDDGTLRPVQRDHVSHACENLVAVRRGVEVNQ